MTQLPLESVEQIAQLAKSLTQPRFYSTLSQAEKAEIMKGVDQLDRGQVIPWEEVKQQMSATLKTAGV